MAQACEFPLVLLMSGAAIDLGDDVVDLTQGDASDGVLAEPGQFRKADAAEVSWDLDDDVFANADNEDIIENLRKYLEKRIKTRRTLLADLGARQDKFRKGLVKMEEQNVLMKNELKQLKAQLEVEKKKIPTLQLVERTFNPKEGPNGEKLT